MVLDVRGGNEPAVNPLRAVASFGLHCLGAIRLAIVKASLVVGFGRAALIVPAHDLGIAPVRRIVQAVFLSKFMARKLRGESDSFN